MSQIKRFDFPGRISVFGRSRNEAGEFLEEVEAMIEDFVPTVSNVSFNRTRDKSLLAKAGIDREGTSLKERIPFHRDPPPSLNLDERLEAWRRERSERRRRGFDLLREEYRREDEERRGEGRK